MNTYSRSRNTHTCEYWNDKAAYLKKTRMDLWNDDYLEFLVTTVWKIHIPVKIVDFGCGLGFLGMKLLPLLPHGSSYTGIDISGKLLEEATCLFRDEPYDATFIRQDLYDVNVQEEYDIAICQAVLRHLPNPKRILKRMTHSVRQDGLVVCIEVNRAFETAGTLIDGIAYTPWKDLNAFSRVWETELDTKGRDHSIGLKIPCYMQELGLQDIDVRINDKASFITPSQEAYDDIMSNLQTTDGGNRSDTFENHERSISLVKALCLVISYGYKR